MNLTGFEEDSLVALNDLLFVMSLFCTPGSNDIT